MREQQKPPAGDVCNEERPETLAPNGEDAPNGNEEKTAALKSTQSKVTLRGDIEKDACTRRKICAFKMVEDTAEDCALLLLTPKDGGSRCI